MDSMTRELFKRDAANDTIWTFGGYKTKKSNGAGVTMQAEFNKTAGSSWCNEIDGVGKGEARDNIITAAHSDSHVGYPHPADMPPEYVCFFYESRNKCDPKAGHAEYVESVAGPKGSANDTVFDTKYKYISWGCQWHPKNQDCQAKDHTGHPPGKDC
ncbi:hypothetical protein SLS60_010369 [Paraconiothyrium brasiliense]|uniref:Uncharacterized protein n=1 Tax=Paraconiothyrium brasiliense TaxID=300254 RepID=A0ABR3QR18_9PLEO